MGRCGENNLFMHVRDSLFLLCVLLIEYSICEAISEKILFSHLTSVLIVTKNKNMTCMCQLVSNV